MQRLWDVASPATWGILLVAATFLLAGFILLSHTLVRGKAYGDDFGGLLHRGRLEWTLRLGAACLCAGAALWAYQLGAGVALTGLLAAGAGAGAGLEISARLRS